MYSRGRLKFRLANYYNFAMIAGFIRPMNCKFPTSMIAPSRFEFHKPNQFFVRVHNEALTVARVRVPPRAVRSAIPSTLEWLLGFEATLENRHADEVERVPPDCFRPGWPGRDSAGRNHLRRLRRVAVARKISCRQSVLWLILVSCVSGGGKP